VTDLRQDITRALAGLWGTEPGDPHTGAALEAYLEALLPAVEPHITDPDAVATQAVLGLPVRLRAHRAIHQLSMRDVASAVGVSASTIHRIEHGKDYAVDSLIRITTYLGGHNS
jgi:DNA-binding XRE family transcriptional regulator